MNFLSFLLTSTTFVPTDGSAASAAADGTGAAASGGLFSNPITMVIAYCVLIFGVFYLFSIKPAKKRQKQMQEQRDAIAVGDSVVTNAGYFGTVVDITYDCFIIEFGMNKGVRIPVLKTEVYGKREPNMSNEAPPEPEKPAKRGLFRRSE